MSRRKPTRHWMFAVVVIVVIVFDYRNGIIRVLDCKKMMFLPSNGTVGIGVGISLFDMTLGHTECAHSGLFISVTIK